MSDDKKKELGLTANTIITIVFGVVIAALSWANRAQLENLSLKQDKAILQAQSDAQERFLTKQEFQAEEVTLKAQIAAATESTEKVTEALSDLKTDTAVIKAEIQKQKN
jgi:hypothetical protein